MMAQRERLQKFYSRLPLENADVVLHFGWGRGDCGEILRQRAKAGARVIVFEPDEDAFRQSTPPDDARFQFVVGSNVPHFFDNWGLGEFQETDQFLWVEQQHGPLADALKLQFKTHLRDRAANLLTHFQNGEKYFENAIRNFEYQRDADAGRLFGKFRNIPLIIVSAGPSLNLNIHHLRGIEDRCFVLSVDTALRPLLAAGVRPHAVITADPSELNAQHIAGVMPDSSYLIAEQTVHPDALQSGQRRFLFGLGLFPDSLFAKYGFGKTRLEAWGSVATTALDLACRMGANPIIFAGQDFAYSWNRDYASNTIYHSNWFDVHESGTARARDIYGGEAYTTENLIAYRDFFVRRMKQSANVRFINATEGGILTEGAEIAKLKDALAQHCVRPVDTTDRLRTCYRASNVSRTALQHLKQALAERRTNCGCLGDFLELTAKKHLLRKETLEIDRVILRGVQCLP